MKYSSLKNMENFCIPKNFFGMHCISFTMFIIITLFSANIASGAEGISVPFKKTPVITGKTGAASEVSKAYIPKDQLTQETGKEAQKMITKEGLKTEKEQAPFVKNLFNMFKALFGVLALICGISGAILFYKWLKNKSILIKTQQQAVQASLESREPETVSEAVASFVKHRIRK